MSEQAAITWHYLPELPPEERKYLVAVNLGHRDTVIVGVFGGWWGGSAYWVMDGDHGIGGVYAWAEMPAVPPTKGKL